eukprot:GHVS01045484.1.p1 GENE.GHVS01045484.1~~GHVS01045484.1.p1  ORF type:complete len:331 (+),score=47.03 GHVS01045484.1:496-1488(+)
MESYVVEVSCLFATHVLFNTYIDMCRLENQVGDISAIEAMLVNAAANATSLSISSVVRNIITTAEVFSPAVEEFPDIAFDLVQCPNARVGISASPALLGMAPQGGQLSVDGLIACAAKMRETLAQDNTIRSDELCYTATSVAEAVVALKSAADKVSNGAMCVVWINGGLSITQLEELVEDLRNLEENTFISTIIQSADGTESDTIAKMKDACPLARIVSTDGGAQTQTSARMLQLAHGGLIETLRELKRECDGSSRGCESVFISISDVTATADANGLLNSHLRLAAMWWLCALSTRGVLDVTEVTKAEEEAVSRYKQLFGSLLPTQKYGG